MAEGPFRLDHDQKLALAWGVQYNPPGRAWWTALNGRYDSGLVTEIEDVAAIAADPDLAFGLSFVNFQAVPPRVKGRAIWNWLVGVDLFKKERYKTSLQFQIANLTDKTGLYNFLSVFSGTHVIPPRTFSGRVVVHF